MGELVMELSKSIASWIWKKVNLDKDDESWCSMMFEDAEKQIDKLIEKDKKED